MKIQNLMLFTVASIGIAATFSAAAESEFLLGNKSYTIPAGNETKIDEIIALIESGNDVSKFGVKEQTVGISVNDLNLKSVKSDLNTLGGDRLVVYSQFKTADLNTYDQALSYTCPSNMFISSMSSIHSDHHEDRVFSVVCTKFKTANGNRVYRRTTKWSGYINSGDDAFNYTCPNGQFLVGMSSRHYNHLEDRTFNFNCGGMAYSSYGSILTPENCRSTSYTLFDAPWTLGGHGAMVGMASRHENRYEDRTFAVSYCEALSDW
ncbi:dermatopontin-like protein (plasmid) [Pseudoalteromonas sp. T1lg65]|uniref:dermatopontin-like protein n=1 Tax=Pseudoalteromonas sp. T1lg65 TaxID=2077101 RepID=UPI003F7A9A8F